MNTRVNMNPQRAIFPVDSPYVVRNLHWMLEILQSSVGPKGNLKILVTSGGHFDVTSSSSGILSRLDVNCPVCTYIIQTALKLNDFGLYFCIAVTYFLYCTFQTEAFQSNHRCVIERLKAIKSKILHALDSPCVKHKAEISSQQVFLPLVKLILSKTSLSPSSLDVLSVQIVKAFLLSVDDSLGKIGRSYTCFEEGCENFEAFPGVLYRLEEATNIDRRAIDKLNKESVSLVILTCMLVPEKGRTLEKILVELSTLVELEVNLIACQKVVDERIKFLMKRKGVIVLERMGEEATRGLEFISSACPLGDVGDIRTEGLEKIFGKLTGVRLVERAHCSYLLLENTEAPCSTLLVHTRAVGGLDSLKSSVRQCMSTLQLVAGSPYLIPGGGCFEGLILTALDLKDEDFDFFQITRTFAKALLHGAGHSSPKVDTTYGHVWEERAACSCGMLRTNDLKAPEFLDVAHLDLNNISKHSPFERLNYIFDSFETKRNAILLALDTIMNILDIGLIVYK